MSIENISGNYLDRETDGWMTLNIMGDMGRPTTWRPVGVKLKGSESLGMNASGRATELILMGLVRKTGVQKRIRNSRAVEDYLELTEAGLVLYETRDLRRYKKMLSHYRHLEKMKAERLAPIKKAQDEAIRAYFVRMSASR